MGKKPKGQNVREQRPKEPFPVRYFTELINIYLILLFIVFPLYVGKDFTDIGTAKGRFFRMITYYVTFMGVVRIPVFPLLILIGMILFIVYAAKSWGTEESDTYRNILRLETTDYFALTYLIISVVSCIFTPYRTYFMWGYPTWYMGLTCQIALVAVYFLVSRFWRWNKRAFIVFMIVMFLIMVLGVLNYFKIDPLGFYHGFEDLKLRRSFISTIGQRTMYSGYIMTLFPLGVWIYMDAEDRRIKAVSTFFLIIGFLTIVTQNSVSALMGLFAMYVVFFQIAFRENRWGKAFLEVLLIMLLTWRLAGLLQIMFPERTEDMKLERIMAYLCLGKGMWILILIIAAVYVLLIRRYKKGLNISSLSLVRNAVMVLILISVAGIIIYIPLNTMGILPEALRHGQNALKGENYLIFNENWGNKRGLNWIVSVKTIAATLKDDPVRFFLGAGPDEFYEILMHYYGDEVNSYYSKIINCAHNEWLDRMINSGIVGGIAYLGIFISSFTVMLKNLGMHKELAAIMACIASYFAHDFFCYQRITCTPFIFVLMAAGLNIIRFNGMHSITE